MERLSHPLYRSQSLDALQRGSRGTERDRDPTPLKPKRTQSEMKAETRRSPTPGKDGKPLSKSYTQGVAVSSDVMVHVKQSSDVSAASSDGGRRQWLNQEVIVPVKSEGVKSEPSPQTSEGDKRKSRVDTEAAREFASLMDQVLDSPGRTEEGTMPSPTSASKLFASSSSSPKTPPSKPQRKKKPSNASVISEDNPPDFFTTAETGEEEVFQAVKSVAIHASVPGRRHHDSDTEKEEVQEDEIQASFVKREVVIPDTDTVQFTAKQDQTEPDEAQERSPSPPLRFVYVQKPGRAESPDGDPVEEDAIEATVASRDNLAAPLPSSARKAEEGESQRIRLDDQALSGLLVSDASGFPPGGRIGFSLQSDGASQNSLDSFSDVILSRSSSSSEVCSADRETDDGTPTMDALPNRMTNKAWHPPHHLSDSGSDDRTSDSFQPIRWNDDDDDEDDNAEDDDGREEDKENREDGLAWSGKRLVRSGSFSEIPQDDTLSDWTDKNVLKDDDDDDDDQGEEENASTTSAGKRSEVGDMYLESDSDAGETHRTLLQTPRDVFKARENLASLSDLSNSVSSSRSSSPVVINGPADPSLSWQSSGVAGGVVGVKTGGPLELSRPAASDNNANSKTISFSVNASTEDDVDC